MVADSERRDMVGAQWATIMELLECLEHERRAVFVLHEIEGLTPAQIADDLEMPVAAVEALLCAAHLDFEEAVRRRHAAERHSVHDAGTLHLPLSPSSILRIARMLPAPEVSADAEARVWAGIQERIAADPAYQGPALRPHRLMPGRFIDAGTAFVAGMVAGAVVAAVGLGALHRTPPPPRPPAPHAAVAPGATGDRYLLASLPVSPASTAPAASPSPRPLLEDDDENERRCLQAAGAALAAPGANPGAALGVLSRCEPRSPRGARLPEARDRVRQPVESGENRR